METDNQLDVDPLKYFSRVCDDIRQNMDQQVQLKSSDTELDDGMMNNLRMQGSFSFLTLKQLNRLAQIRCKNIKDSTSEAKLKLDGYYLTLQNLQYEIGHLHREITKCLEFRSRHDSIPLVEVDKFYTDAPADISKPDITRDDEHAQTLARLDWELEQRKRLAEKVSELEKDKEQALNKIEKKKQDFQMLAPCLDNLLKASLPLQDAFDLPLDKTKTEQDLANLLPRPLFVLFLQAKAYQEACDPSVEVSIEGDIQAANKLQQTDDKRTLVVFNNQQQSDEESESEQEDIDDQDSERIRKKHKKSSKKSKYENESKKVGNENTKLHPLHVAICLNNLFQGSRLELNFFYYIKLGFASVKANLTVPDAKFKNDFMLENDGLLHCMLSEDYGDEVPNPGANHLVGNWSVSSNVQVAGYPYMWVQRMCGLDFISSNHNVGEDMKISFKHVGNSFQLLQKRVESRLLLIKQLVQFDENLISCNSLTNSTVAQSSLDKWTQLSWAEYRKLNHNKEVLELGLCGEDSEKGNPFKRHAYFEATFKRNSVDGERLATFKVAVALFPDYPRHLPLLTGRIELGVDAKLASNDYNVRAMEEMINIELPKMVSDENEILSAQLLRFSELFDIYVETSINEGETDFGPSIILSSKCKNSTPIRHQGPARLKPFNMNNKESACRQ